MKNWPVRPGFPGGAELAESALQHSGQFADKAVARGSDMADSARERVGQRVNGRRKHRW